MIAEMFRSNPLIGPDGKDYQSIEALEQAHQEWNDQNLRKISRMPLVSPRIRVGDFARLIRRAIGEFPLDKLAKTITRIKETR